MAKWKCFGCGTELEQYETTSHMCKEQKMETRDEMIARHARELAELEAPWWEPWFTEDPVKNLIDNQDMNNRLVKDWIMYVLPSIIRKREKVGIILHRQGDKPYEDEYFIKVGGVSHIFSKHAVERLAGRPLAPGERVEL